MLVNYELLFDIGIYTEKARRVAGLLKRGIKFTPTQSDVNAILKMLNENRVQA